MPTLTIIVGLPGSGKTTHAKDRYENVYHDVTHPNHRYGPKGLAEVVALLKDGHDVVAEDCYFCLKAGRDQFCKWIEEFVPGVQLEWVFFENSAPKCLSNILGDKAAGKHGDFKGRIATFASLVERYEIPAESEILLVHSAYGEPEFASLQDVKNKLTELIS